MLNGGCFYGEGGQFPEVQRRDSRETGCEFSAAFGALVLPLERREARVRVPSLANGSRADFGMITRGVRDEKDRGV